MKVCILYGWAEGPWQGKKLRQTLRDKDFSITENAREADVLIAHSGGCYFLPESSKASLVFLVGLPYWPGKHPMRSLNEKIRAELKDVWWYKKTFFNTYYFISRPRRWVRMYRSWKKQALPSLSGAPTFLVRNESDHFMHPVDTRSLADKKRWKLVVFSGSHDDIWANPLPYVDFILENVK